MIILPLNPLRGHMYHHQLLFRKMENIDYWTPLWNALYQNGASAKSEDATHRFWLSLSPEQQAQVSQTIVRKVAAGEFVWYNPIRAIQENIRHSQTLAPEFLSGAQQEQNWKDGIPMVQVKVNGSYRICTQQTQQIFHLDLVKPWPKKED